MGGWVDSPHIVYMILFACDEKGRGEGKTHIKEGEEKKEKGSSRMLEPPTHPPTSSKREKRMGVFFYLRVGRDQPQQTEEEM